MKELVQLVFINLVVSFDNVGVIALATRNLPCDKAVMARRIGIGLSIVMKMLFIAVIGLLFDVPWLHIRIVGGILLIFITFNMLRQQTQETVRTIKNDGSKGDSYVLAIVSIIAADVSMSIDNVVAMLGVIASDGHDLVVKDFIIAFLGLLICVPILLWFSSAVTSLMERFPLITYLCAGYLIYISVKMIFEDEMIQLFFQQINFSFAKPSAVLCGGLVVVYGLFAGKKSFTGIHIRSHLLLPIYGIVIGYSLVTVAVISYLSTNPMLDGYQLNVQMIYGFEPSGINAVYTIGTSSNLFALCAILLAGIIAKDRKKLSYPAMLFSNMKYMIVFVGLELTVCTIGLGFTFGLGEFNPFRYFLVLPVQVFLLFTYSAVFCMFSVFIRSNSILITVGLLYEILESAGAAILSEKWTLGAEFFPSYHIASLSSQIYNRKLLVIVTIIAILYVILATYLGNCRYKSDYN